MKRVLVVMMVVVIAVVFTTGTASAKTNDLQLAKNWAKNHGGGYTIEKVITVSKGGAKGKVQGTKYVVRYPKKVKKGKKVTCYMIEKNGDVKAMVCLGKVK